MSKLVFREAFSETYDIKLDDGFCVANCGIGKDWLTVYLIETHPEHRGKGEAQRLLRKLKTRCEQTGRILRVWCPMNDVIKHICTKLNIEIT